MNFPIYAERVIIEDLVSVSKKVEDNPQTLRDKDRVQAETNMSVCKYISHEIYKKTMEEKVILANAKILHKKQNPNFKFGGKVN